MAEPATFPAPAVSWPGAPVFRVRYEYMRVPWDEINDYGAKGWRLTAAPPMQEVKVTLGQPTPGEVMFVMERELKEGDRF